MPAPVASRRRLTSAAVKSAMPLPRSLVSGGLVPGSAPSRSRPARARGGEEGAFPEGCGGRGPSSAVLGALRAGVRAPGGGHALDRGDLVRGHGRGLGGGLQQRGGGLRQRGGGLRQRGG